MVCEGEPIVLRSTFSAAEEGLELESFATVGELERCVLHL